MRLSASTLLLLATLPLAGGCDQLSELLELPNPKKDALRLEGEGRAIGGACRHAGRSLEDCYTLNSSAEKSSVFAGWREMNDYMMEHKIEVVPSQLAPATPAAKAAGEPAPAAKAPGH